MSKRAAEPPKRISVLRLQRKAACRQYRAARWFLLPEVELRRGCVKAAVACKSAETDNETGGSRLQIWQNKIAICPNNASPPDGHIIHEQALPACEGCLWPQVAESAEFEIRLDNKSRQQIANLLQQCKRQGRYREAATAEATLMPSRALETMPPA